MDRRRCRRGQAGRGRRFGRASGRHSESDRFRRNGARSESFREAADSDRPCAHRTSVEGVDAGSYSECPADSRRRRDLAIMSGGASPVSALPRRVGFSGWIAARTDILLAGAVALAFAFKLILVFRININWDEFYYLSFVQDYLRGTISDRFQTLHVHLFAWLPNLATDEIGQILIARIVMAGCAIGSALLLYGIA